MHVENRKLCQSHVIVIAVKPYLVAKVMEDIKEHLEPHHVIVSLAAGVALADLCKVSAARTQRRVAAFEVLLKIF